MTKHTALRQAVLLGAAAIAFCWGGTPAKADVSHARIVRLSLVQGDVRFARDVKGDPLADSNAAWERAELNLPIRQGYVLATDSGRAEVEFESGAMAFLAENTVLEFYDLSLEDGGRTTRLILRQGSAEFYVNPAKNDYFSVTGGDFSVQAEGRTTFRLDNFDDGSNVNVLQGRVAVLSKDKNTRLEKGESLSIRAGEADSMTVGRAPASDAFDHWVSGRIENVATATNASLQYSNSYGYTSGFGDLYTYGSWFPVAGYGYCWRPFGAGFGWSPFDFGNWYYDPFFGWTFIGNQPWGWLPYHYGGWIFQPGFGWVWNPGGSFWGGRPVRWRPVTGVWVRSAGMLGLVPAHPMDVTNKTPLNMSRGVFPVSQRGILGRVDVTEGERWKVEKHPSRDAISSSLASAEMPGRVSRSIAGGASGARSNNAGGESGIVYDPSERRFVNGRMNSPRSAEVQAETGRDTRRATTNTGTQATTPNSSTEIRQDRPVSNRMPAGEANRSTPPTPPPARTLPPPPRPVVTPPPVAPRASGGERSSGEGPRWGGSSGPSPSPSPSAGSAPRASGGGSSGTAPRGSSSGGRPH